MLKNRFFWSLVVLSVVVGLVKGQSTPLTTESSTNEDYNVGTDETTTQPVPTSTVPATLGSATTTSATSNPNSTSANSSMNSALGLEMTTISDPVSTTGVDEDDDDDYYYDDYNENDDESDDWYYDEYYNDYNYDDEDNGPGPGVMRVLNNSLKLTKRNNKCDQLISANLDSLSIIRKTEPKIPMDIDVAMILISLNELSDGKKDKFVFIKPIFCC